MTRYIDVEDFKEEVRKLGKSLLNEWDTQGVLSVLERVPTADVAPVIHGHWIYQGLSPYNCFSRCSCCDVVFDGYETLEYCPKCGAKMDEVVVGS